MKVKNIVVINGEEVEIESLSKKEKESLAHNLNKEALGSINYYEERDLSERA